MFLTVEVPNFVIVSHLVMTDRAIPRLVPSHSYSRMRYSRFARVHIVFSEVHEVQLTFSNWLSFESVSNVHANYVKNYVEPLLLMRYSRFLRIL